MTQMEFIPLKTPSGELAGHARVKDGVVRFALRNPMKGRAVVLTKAGGIVTDLTSGAAVTSQVLAVALEEGGKLLASGLARGVTLSKDELRRRVQIYAGDSVKRIERREPEPAREEKRSPEARPPERREPEPPREEKKSPEARPSERREPEPPREEKKSPEPTPFEPRRREAPKQPEDPERIRDRELSYTAVLENSALFQSPENPVDADVKKTREQELKHTAAMEKTPLFQKQSKITLPQRSRGADEAEARHSEPTAAAVKRAERYEPRETPEETRRQELSNMAAMEPQKETEEQPLKRSASNVRERELRYTAGVADSDVKRAAMFRPAASMFRENYAERAGGDDEAWTPPTPAPMPPKEEPLRRAPEKAHPLFAAEAGAAEALSSPPEQPLTDPDTEAFFALLRRSDAVYRSIYEPVTPKEPQDPLPFSRSAANPVPSWHGEVDALLNQVTEQQRINIPNPFPHIFPNAAFVKIVKNGVTERLEGDWRRGAERFRVHAVPGSYSPMPPQELAGYTRYIRSRAGGFWVKVVDMNPTLPS